MPRHNPFAPTIPGFAEYAYRPERPPRKRRAPTNRYLWVRRVKGGAFQARVWLGVHAGGSLNLGLFTLADHPDDQGKPLGAAAEWTAARASREFFKLYRPHAGGGLRETLAALKARRLIPEHVLPPRVRRHPGGSYYARVKKGGRVLETPGGFACPWACYAAMCAVLAREFPPGPSKSELRAAARRERERKRRQREERRYRGGLLFAPDA